MMVAPQNGAQRPQVLPGFEHITRSWDATLGICSAKILPGEFYVTVAEEVITTVLGSCVSACIRDPHSGAGGMNHFMLPGDNGRKNDKWGGTDCLSTRYGVAAMEALINELMKQGSHKDCLELKLFGGGEVLRMQSNNVGERNINFVTEFVESERMTVVAEDLGGRHPRVVNFFPKSGKVMIRRLRSLQSKAIATQERTYERALNNQEELGEIDLFD